MKKYFMILAVVLPILVLVLTRSITRDHFRNNAAKWADRSIHKTNVITAKQLDESDGKTLVIELDDLAEATGIKGEVIHIPADRLLDKDNQKKMRGAGGNIVLVSEDPALSARMWMMLSQMGYKKLFILNDSTDNEALKYKFQPDTVTRPEL
jgi:hypothetical protein